ncbi:unnamed protein product [Bathycoccus prasinos]
MKNSNILGKDTYVLTTGLKTRPKPVRKRKIAMRKRRNIGKFYCFTLLIFYGSINFLKKFLGKSKNTESYIREYTSRGFVITHFSGSGFNNQIHQVLNGIAISKSLNRTYCLPPFVRRKSDEINSTVKFTDFIEIYDLHNIRKIVKIESMERCSSLCNNNVDFIVNMSPSQISAPSYNRQDIMKRMGFNTDFNSFWKNKRLKNLGNKWVDWHDESQVASELGYITEKCLELFQPFPASKLIVDGSMRYVPSSLKLQKSIESTAKKIELELFANRPYISVHWRYEYQKRGESKCRKKSLPSKGSGDVCFVIFLKKYHSTKRDYLNFGECKNCEKYLRYVHIDDVGSALQSFQTASGVNDIYLASDADMKILKEVRKYVSFKMTMDSGFGRSVLENEDMEMVSVIEQALCAHGKAFLGTSYSTWTTTVWMLRSQSKENINQVDGFLDFL